MYKQVHYDESSNTMHLWGDGTTKIKIPERGVVDDLGYFTFPYKKYAYKIDPNGKFTSISGQKCSKVTSWEDHAVKNGIILEHDVAPITRTLIDLYGDSDDLSQDVVVLDFDIEVERGDKYSKAEDADNPITAIAYKLSNRSDYVCLLLDKNSDPETRTVQIPVTYDDPEKDTRTLSGIIKTFSKEIDLLNYFLDEYQEFGHSIITGWNVKGFDVPYLYNRLKNLMGYQEALKLSPLNKVRPGKGNFRETIYSLGGLAILDYMELYKKFTYTELANYRLNTVSKKELGRSKIEYEGDLDQLYRDDIFKYAIYNIIDVDLIEEMDEKLDFINIARGICHKGHVSYNSIEYTSAYLDGAALTYCRRKGLIVQSTKTEDLGKAQGAFVKQPVPGLYSWIYDLDLLSLYPLTIITLNISPETKFAKIKNWDENEYVRGTERQYKVEFVYTDNVSDQFQDVFQAVQRKLFEIKEGSKELYEFLTNNNLSIASNGFIYKMDTPGLIPSILALWYSERKAFKDQRKKYEKEGNKELASYYDRAQLITKILLNSFYGVLLLPSFRLYDRDNGEAVTLTGQSVIHHAARAADFFYNRELKEHDTNYEIEYEDGTKAVVHGFDLIDGRYVFEMEKSMT